MDWGLIYSEMQKWQTGIGAVLGFGALMVAALWNFRLNRKRDAQLRQDETLAIATALYGEILGLREATARMAKGVSKAYLDYGLGRRREDPFNRYFFEMFPLPAPLLYEALASKVGLLPADLLLQIVNFYSAYAEAKAWLPKLEDDPDRGFSYGILYVLHPAKAAVEEVKPALRSIERMAGIGAPPADPDTGDAASVVEMEELQWEVGQDSEPPAPPLPTDRTEPGHKLMPK